MKFSELWGSQILKKAGHTSHHGYFSLLGLDISNDQGRGLVALKNQQICT